MYATYYLNSGDSVAAGNRNETILLKPGIKQLVNISRTIGLKLSGSIRSLDGVYNSRKNRKTIFNLGMTPNIPENKGNRKNKAWKEAIIQSQNL